MFDIQEQLKKLPDKPGVYLMKDENEEIIYIGKAISLKNRVRQYFQSLKHHPPKVKAMVSNITEFEYILTDTELEALMLESTLIKKHRPKYNVLLRDDKYYPYIKITMKERFPRVLVTRKMTKDGSRYFGPYLQAGAVNQTLELLKKYYSIRTCSKNLEKLHERPCLNYHIQKCHGPCTGKISHEDYMKIIQEIILFLSGKQDELIMTLEEKMKKAAEDMKYERAAEYRDQIQAIQRIMEKQKVVLAPENDQDFIALARDEEDTCVMVFFVRQGKLMGREHYMITATPDDDRREIMSSFIKQFYGGTTYIPKEIFIHDEIEDQQLIEQWLSTKRESKVNIKSPQRGEKKAFLEMVHKNAVEMLMHFKEKIKLEKNKREGALEELASYLELDKIPYRIEAYDISNTQGVQSVGSMVVFENGKAKYSDYRRFKIKTIEGPNDYGSMQEVIFRRFKKGLEEAENLKEKGIVDEEGKFSRMPDLILIDGGIGQVNAALDVLKALQIDIPTAGMVKDEKHKTRDLVYNNREAGVGKHSFAFQLIGKIQEEAHRFAITYHKSLRGKTVIASILDDISGIGENRRIALLKHFGGIDKIKQASVEELSEVKGMNKRIAEEVYMHFQKKKREEE
ncbi:MAG: excinuclease ABC subunit UvrC [Bacillota bacterium]